MKSVSVRDLQRAIKKCVDASQEERVVITRNGKPAALMIGVEGQDWESIALQTSPAFWRLIEKRRKEKSLPLSEVRRLLKTPRKKGRRADL